MVDWIDALPKSYYIFSYHIPLTPSLGAPHTFGGDILLSDLLITIWRLTFNFFIFQAPEDDYFSVHIRRVGDWTNALAKACHTEEDEYTAASKMPM